MVELPESHSKSSGRKPRGSEAGKPVRRGRQRVCQTRSGGVDGIVAALEDLLKAYEQVTSNKGTAGVNGMSVEQLKPYLQEHWAMI